MTRMQRIAWGLAALLVLLLAGVAAAGSSGPHAVDWQVLTGGGAPAVSGSGLVALNGSLGQTAIGSSAIGDTSLGAGFWYATGEHNYQIYLPITLRNQ
ncbi:MAG TPA: hypothetical protein VLY63_02410 [Anaerolineae bacterium]|nr:hypothetical protein [Anaerolineae bacterium]